MMIQNFMLFIFFITWSALLRHFAFFLIKDCLNTYQNKIAYCYNPLTSLFQTNKLFFKQICSSCILKVQKWIPACAKTRVINTYTGILKKLWIHQIFIFFIKCLQQICCLDVLAALWWLFAAHQITCYIPAYFIFLSALCITIFTDSAQMLISRFVSLYLAPIGIILAAAHLLPIDPLESFLAACTGYFLFWLINKIFNLCKGYDGLGQGDFELMACIGSFSGFLGCWFTILLGSIAGTLFGAVYIIVTKKNNPKLPFGPFLAFGASTFILFQNQILQTIIKIYA